MPNRTPITKSHTVIQTIILIIVMYSDLKNVDVIRDQKGRILDIQLPAHASSRVPYSFLDQIDTEHEYQCSDNHNSCESKLAARSRVRSLEAPTNVSDKSCANGQKNAGSCGKEKSRNTSGTSDAVKSTQGPQGVTILIEQILTTAY